MSHTTATARKVFALDPINDQRHVLGERPNARESLVFMLQLPEHDVAAFVYSWVSGEGRAGAAFCVYGPAVGQEAIFEVVDGLPVPATQGFGDWRVGGAHVRHGAPLQVADVTFEGREASLEYRFDAMHPAYNYGSHPGGCPQWFADDRFEQSGRVRGVLRFRGRDIPFDTFGHRDHSWGTRDWGIAQHWKWLEAQAAPDLAVHVFECSARGKNTVHGYVQKDGLIAEVVDVATEFETDASFVHVRQKSVIRDSAGRTTTVHGTTFAFFEFKVSPLATLNESSMAVTIDGVKGVGHVEMCWPKAYLDYLRQGA